ncbi:MAG: GNAT family N-acetyltransferase [Patescibacteria group bacterium]
MDFVKLNQSHRNQLLELEWKMYWNNGKWKELWEKEAKDKFGDLISDYLQSYPQGCFGLVEKDELMGSIFLLKLSELKPIPYVNKVHDYLDENGDIAYVSFFVVKKGDRDEEIAQKLYDNAEEVALSIGCKKITVVINNSPLEEEILKGNKYERSNEEYQWEIYPGMVVPCYIYTHSL